MTNLDSIFKSRDVTLPKKVRLVKACPVPSGGFLPILEVRRTPGPKPLSTWRNWVPRKEWRGGLMRLGARFPACTLATRRVGVSIDCHVGDAPPVVFVLSQPG